MMKHHLVLLPAPLGLLDAGVVPLKPPGLALLGGLTMEQAGNL